MRTKVTHSHYAHSCQPKIDESTTLHWTMYNIYNKKFIFDKWTLVMSLTCHLLLSSIDSIIIDEVFPFLVFVFFLPFDILNGTIKTTDITRLFNASMFSTPNNSNIITNNVHHIQLICYTFFPLSIEWFCMPPVFSFFCEKLRTILFYVTKSYFGKLTFNFAKLVKLNIFLSLVKTLH